MSSFAVKEKNRAALACGASSVNTQSSISVWRRRGGKMAAQMIGPCRFLGGIPERPSESCHLFSLLCCRNGLRLNDIFVFNLEDEASECI